MMIYEQAAKVKQDSFLLAAIDADTRNQALRGIVEALRKQKDEIIKENQADLAAAKEAGIDAPVLKRLRFDEEKLAGVIAGVEDLIALPDPLGREQMKRKLDEDLYYIRETCPIGVIGVIFEARPDAMVQISTLCLKSGNAAILKGGSEATRTNKKVFQVIHEAAVKAGMPQNCMMQVEARSEITELLACDAFVDLLIPRGSNAFVQYIMSNTRIPVMGHADGICHIYADKELDIDKSVRVIVDAKTQYTAVCNAAETLLVHKDIAPRLLPALDVALREKNVEVRGTERVQELIACEKAVDEDFATEYLDAIISIKIVDSIEEAITHINHYGSHHTDCILTEDERAAEQFMRYVDSAGVYQNCSTRFADGYRYGFGAEVGISTGKLHARGPVGLEGLCTYKYKMFGNGNIVADYAEGRKKFHFQDM